jgi:hypothetical protein
MPRKALLQSLLVTLGLAGTLAASAGSMLAEDPPAVAGAPFSGVMNMQSATNFADGNRIVRTNTVRYFRDGQGRTRTERQGLNIMQGSPALGGPVVTISDPVSSMQAHLFTTQQTASVVKLPRGVPVSRTATVSACNGEDIPPFALMGMGMAIGAGQYTEASTSTASLGQKVVNGLTATGCRIVRTIPAGVLGNEKPITSTTDQWVSSELGMTVQLSETSSLGGSVTMNLEQVVQSEPDASLFVVPANYKTTEIPVSTVTGTGGVVSSTAVATFTGQSTTSSAGSH